jgi:2-keto-4-pentenoate hydratase/2-oxohepta-3-ene-1,7-dioic acid hydratase in catechol pathway
MACAVALPSAQAPAAGERFGIGTFREGQRTFIGLVVRDAFVIDLAAAATATKQQVPTTVVGIIQQYDTGAGNALKAIVKQVAGNLTANRPAYVYDLKSLDTLPPYEPKTALFARANYLEHFLEMGGGGTRDAEVDLRNRPAAQQVLEKPPPSLPGIWERAASDRRQNPYLFLVPPTIFSSDGDPIQVPIKRSQIDYECEMVAVMGVRPARRVTAAQAPAHVFGFTQVNDVSDRQGRNPEGGSDWWVQKGQDTFKPWGPYIVPKEFIADPLNTPMKFTLSGRVLQEDTTRSMIHNFYEMIQYASNVQTLRAGDIIATGTPSGVGTARKPPVYMKAGDVAVCSYEGLGTLTNPIVAEAAPAATSSAALR